MECKKCGRLLKPGMVKCPKCRALVDSVEPAKICPLCKRQGEPGDEICGFCDIELIYQFQVDVSSASDESQNPINDSAGQHPCTVPSGIYIQNSQLDAELEHQRRLVQLRESVIASMQGEDYISAEGYLSEYLEYYPQDGWAEGQLSEVRKHLEDQRECLLKEGLLQLQREAEEEEQVCLEQKHKGTESKCEQLKSQIESLIDKRKWDEARQLLLDEYGKLNAGDENWIKEKLSKIVTEMPQLTPFEMVLVEGGSFMMGSNEGSVGEKPVHTVTVSSFYIGKYPVTQKEYEAVMGDNPSLSWRRGGNYPVETVTWYDAIEFCNKLSERESLTPVYTINKNHKDPANENAMFDNLKWTVTVNWSANGYRLPTEAEWEYAARGGKKSKGYKYSGSNDINQVAKYYDNSKTGQYQHVQPVGTKKPNELGIYDMSGCISELCWDWYGRYTAGSKTNPWGANNGQARVQRGGHWSSSPSGCTVSSRSSGFGLGSESVCVGFRVCRRVP